MSAPRIVFSDTKKSKSHEKLFHEIVKKFEHDMHAFHRFSASWPERFWAVEFINRFIELDDDYLIPSPLKEHFVFNVICEKASDKNDYIKVNKDNLFCLEEIGNFEQFDPLDVVFVDIRRSFISSEDGYRMWRNLSNLTTNLVILVGER